VPVDPEWTEYGINPPPVPPKRRGDDRSPLQATNLPAAERDVEASRGESYAPKLEADRVRDADGSIRGDDGDHFGSGAIRPAMEALPSKTSAPCRRGGGGGGSFRRRERR
jgi:hypothetical protein